MKPFAEFMVLGKNVSKSDLGDVFVSYQGLNAWLRLDLSYSAYKLDTRTSVTQKTVCSATKEIS